MKNETHKPFKFTAMILALALLFPFTSEALHFFNHHGHEHCTENTTTHFHKHDFECEIFDFQLSPTTTFLASNDEKVIENSFGLLVFHSDSFYSNLKLHNTTLRGPPLNS